MNLMDELNRLTRRVQQLEANRGASLRFGQVTGVSPDGHARVRLMDGENMVSHPLRIIQPRTHKDKAQCFPDVGEQVACLFSGQGLEAGVILGAVYSRTDPAAGQDTHMAYLEFEDGTKLSYDRQSHKLKAEVEGEVEVSASKTALVRAEEGVTASTPRVLVLEGGAGVVMRGPSLRFEGMEGGSCKAVIEADLRVRGLTELHGNLSQQGSQGVSGNITATGTITGHPVIGCVHD